MSRWSPSVVAEAPPPVRSALARAFDVGIPLWQQKQAARLAAEKAAEEQRRYEEEQAYRGRAEARSISDSALARQIAASQAAMRAAEAGWQTTPPGEYDRPDPMAPMGGGPPIGRPIRDSGLGMVTPSGEPSGLGMGGGPNVTTGLGVQEPRPRAGNTGPGGQDSQSQFPWEIAERKRIKEEAMARYPFDNGAAMVRDPVSGQTQYLPLRQRWIDEQMKTVDARVAAERTKLDDAARREAELRLQSSLSQENQMAQIRERARLEAEAAALKATADAEKGKGDLTNQAKMKIAGDDTSILKIMDALAAVDQNPQAFGWKTYLPESILQRWDSGGNLTRAELQSAVVAFRKSTFGLAVSQYEKETGRSLLPDKGDSPEKIRRSLEALLRGNEIDRKAIMEVYGQKYSPLLPGMSDTGGRLNRGGAESPLAPGAAPPAATPSRRPNLSRY